MQTPIQNYLIKRAWCLREASKSARDPASRERAEHAASAARDAALQLLDDATAVRLLEALDAAQSALCSVGISGNESSGALRPRTEKMDSLAREVQASRAFSFDDAVAAIRGAAPAGAKGLS